MNIPTKTFLDTPVSDYYHSDSIGSQTLFQYMYEIFLMSIEDGYWCKWAQPEQIAQNNVRVPNAQAAKNCVDHVFEWTEGTAFDAYCENVGHQCDLDPHTDIDWDIVMIRMNELLADGLPEHHVDNAIAHLAYEEKEKREFRAYYLSMPIELRRKAVNEKVSQLQNEIKELKSFIQ